MGQKFSSLFNRPTSLKPKTTALRVNPIPLKPPKVLDPEIQAFQKKEYELAWQASKMFQLSHIDIKSQTIQKAEKNSESLKTSNEVTDSTISMDTIAKFLSGEVPKTVLLNKGLSEAELDEFQRYYSVAIRPPTQPSNESPMNQK
ncbi:hypothetical protein HMI54_009701 [Coelomomyces lativittatus]|nr:hypothetical protein HMI55_000368 [Coelomomyces lativittatus]KAJ1514606.1 hypothetical protein HMI56_000115 [Coelomomyces lativittatus]KAJ1516377.1 hypothetical protein HMI54_009701 [Coelomomyces lativittatus]